MLVWELSVQLGSNFRKATHHHFYVLVGSRRHLTQLVGKQRSGVKVISFVSSASPTEDYCGGEGAD
jgi:hypothetical protein